MRWLAIVSLALLAGCEMNINERTLIHEVYNCEKIGFGGAIVVITRIAESEKTYAYNVYTVTCVAPNQ